MNCFSYVFVTILLFGSLRAQETFDIEAVVGHSVELPCNVTAEAEDDKLNILAWYRNGSSAAFYSRDLRSEDGAGDIASTDGAGGRYRLVESEEEGLAKLQILLVRPSDADIYHCFADFASSPAHKTYVQLKVIEPPQRVWVIHENGTRVATANAGSNTSQNIGPYYVGDTVHLLCVAFGGKPLATLSWWAEQRLVKDTCTPLSEHRVRSDLQRGPLRREDHGLVLTCMATNNQKTQPISIDVIIDMYLPPELVSVRDTSSGPDAGAAPAAAAALGGRARAHDTLQLQCRVLGARPTPTVHWQLNDAPLINLEQNITVEPQQRLVVSEIQLTIGREHDESRVTCCTPANRRAGEQYVCAQALPLTVLYAPVVKIIIDGEVENSTLAVVKGSDVTMYCSYQANPSVYQINWFHEDDIKSNEGGYGDGSMRAALELKNVTSADGGDYVCSASNDEGTEYSDTIVVDVTYPAYCEEESIAEYGLGENESINITCNVKANPAPAAYRWVMVNEAVNVTTFRNEQPHSTAETDGPTLLYQRPNDTAFSTIFCWALNGVIGTRLPHTPCTFLVTDETVPRPPTDCVALKSILGDITVTCQEGHDGGLQQKFKFTVQSLDSGDEVISIVSLEPKFIIQEPKEDDYKFIIIASNDKGDSNTVEIDKDSVIDENVDKAESKSAVSNITTLALALCGGVALVSLAACGLVLCAHERGSRADLPRALADPPLCAYNTEESNCDTYHNSDDGSDCNVRRTESFRRAVSKYPSKNYDVRRSSSFHSTRYMNDMAEPEGSRYGEIRHSNNCRVHSMQNISRKREMDTVCDHLVMRLPPDTNYHVPKPMNTFYTMPRKMRNKMAKQLSDDASEITQNSDGFSLPPPPDEFGTYRAATRIKDIPSKSTPTYTTIKRKNSAKEAPKQQYNDVIISPMNTVGLPTVSGAHNSLYTYPDDLHQGMQRTTGVLTTFKHYSSPRESGL